MIRVRPTEEEEGETEKTASDRVKKKKLCSFFRTLSFFFPFDVARRWADGKEEEEGLPSEGGRDSLAAVVLVGKGRREIAVLFTEKRRILDPWRASYGKGRALLLQGGGA